MLKKLHQIWSAGVSLHLCVVQLACYSWQVIDPTLFLGILFMHTHTVSPRGVPHAHNLPPEHALVHSAAHTVHRVCVLWTLLVNIVYCSCDLHVLSLLYMLCSLRRMVRWLYPSCSMLIECNHQPTRCVNNYHTHVSSKQLYRNLFCSESVFVQCLGIRFLLTLMLLLWNPVDMHEHVCWGTCLLNACSSVTISRDWRSILHERQEQ